MHLAAFCRQFLGQILIPDWSNREFRIAYKLQNPCKSMNLMFLMIDLLNSLLDTIDIYCIGVLNCFCIFVSPFIRLHCSFSRLQFRSLPKTLQNSSCTDFHARFFRAVRSASSRLFSIMFMSRLHSSKRYRFSSNAQF